MRSIERRFKSFEEGRPAASTFLNFCSAIKGEGFEPTLVRRWFKKLVDKDDYEASDKRVLLKHLDSISTPEEYRKQG